MNLFRAQYDTFLSDKPDLAISVVADKEFDSNYIK